MSVPTDSTAGPPSSTAPFGASPGEHRAAGAGPGGAREKPRVCFVDSYLRQGANPIPKQSELLARSLEALGAQVILTSPVVNRPLRVLDIVQTLVRRRRDYDTVCIQAYRRSFPLAVVATAVGKVLLGKRSVVVLRGGKLPELWERRPGPVRWTFRRADDIVSPSGYLDSALREFGFQGTVIPNGIEVESYRFRARSSPEPRLFWLRAFHPIYNPQLAVQTLALVRKTHPGAILTMAGPDDTELDACRRLAAELGVESAVDFTGFLDKAEIPDVAARHDVFLNTSRIDNVPVSVIEAMATGLCVVSTDVDGMPYLLEDGVEGLLVTDDDPEAMAGAVRRILDRPGLGRELSTGARRKAERFDVPKLARTWLDLLEGGASER